MFRDELPEKKIGYLVPRHLVENQAYEFYRMAPPGIMLVLAPCGLGDFTAADVSRVAQSLEIVLDRLLERDVDIILQAGVTLPLLLGVEAHDRLIAHIAEYTAIPAVSHMQNVIAAIKHLGLKNVLVVNKWSDTMNATMKAFFERDGISLAGVCSKSMSPSQFGELPTGDSAQLAYDLGIRGLREYPKADGLYIGGGSWLAQPVSEQLEAEVGKPVICNHSASMWHLLTLLGKWRPCPGHGNLLGGK